MLSFPLSMSVLGKKVSSDNLAKYQLRGTLDVTLEPTANREAYI